MNMKLIARSRAAFFKLCGKHALLSVLCAPREFQRNSRAKTQAAARRSALPPAGRLSPNASSRSNTSTSPGGYDVSRLFHRCARVDALRCFLYDESVGRLAQLVRAPALQAGGRRFEPCTAHHPYAPPFRGDVVQLVRTLPPLCPLSRATLSFFMSTCLGRTVLDSNNSIPSLLTTNVSNKSGNLVLARSKLRRLNYIGFLYGSGTAVSCELCKKGASRIRSYTLEYSPESSTFWEAENATSPRTRFLTRASKQPRI